MVDHSGMGRRIAEARARAGLTQAQLASAVDLDRSALTKVEAGTRRVSALELARIAQRVKERIEWFVTDPPPSILSHRNVTEPGATSSAIDRYAERAARHVEFALRHDDRWSLPTTEPLARPGSADAAEHAAARARTLLGLDASEPVPDLAARLASVGLLAFSFDLGAEAADAASILLPQGGIALVNGHLRVGRRRLALAHELGHYLVADDYTVDWRVEAQDDTAAWESRLDRFARAVLLPPAGLGQAWTKSVERGEDVRTAAVRIASEFCVDMSTLARRLVELGHVSQSRADQVRTVRTTKGDIVELDLVVRHDLAAPYLPRPYVTSVLRLYRGEIVSPARALDLLFDTWDEADLPPSRGSPRARSGPSCPEPEKPMDPTEILGSTPLRCAISPRRTGWEYSRPSSAREQRSSQTPSRQNCALARPATAASRPCWTRAGSSYGSFGALTRSPLSPPSPSCW